MYSSFGAVWKNGSRQAKFFTWQTLSARTAAPAVLAVAPTADGRHQGANHRDGSSHVSPRPCGGNRRRRHSRSAARWSSRGRATDRTPSATDPSAAAVGRAASVARGFAAIDPRPDRRTALARCSAGAGVRAHASSFLAPHPPPPRGACDEAAGRTDHPRGDLGETVSSLLPVSGIANPPRPRPQPGSPRRHDRITRPRRHRYRRRSPRPSTARASPPARAAG